MIPLNYPQNIVEGFECLDCEFPWIVPESADFLNENLNENDVVLEFGSGGSTLFFARRCKHVISIETSNDWFDKVFKRLGEKEIQNFEYYCIPSTEICNWITIQNLSEVTVVLVDTQGGINRSEILETVLKKEMPNLRMIVLDNYSHEELFPTRTFQVKGKWRSDYFNHPQWAGSGTEIISKIK